MTAFWATPTMTVGHLLFAGVLTGYMGLAALIEERDLIAHFGRQYEEYCRSVPRFIPRWKRTATLVSEPPNNSDTLRPTAEGLAGRLEPQSQSAT
jgi:hypothetical protein